MAKRPEVQKTVRDVATVAKDQASAAKDQVSAATHKVTEKLPSSDGPADATAAVPRNDLPQGI